jgi:hypothetical protein
VRWGSDAFAAFVAAAACLGARGASADDSSDPTRGRIDGDLALVLGAGAVVAPRAPRVEAEFRFRYLDSAGGFVTYEDAAGLGSDPRRLLGAGLEVRPLFLARWLSGLETPRARIDLITDSFGLELGLFISQPSWASGWRGGFQAGLGLEIPVLPKATGPWFGVHAGLRWSEAAVSTGIVRDVDDRAGYMAITVAWHQMVSTHLVDLGDRPPR